MDNSLIGKKSLGQHWLNDEISLDSIVSSIDINSTDTILEIGPGLGSLTSRLILGAKKVVAVELDQEAINRLKMNIISPKLEIIQADILKFNLDQLPADYKVVANIPYYLTSKLLRLLCESSNPFSKATVLVQKEVAHRVAAGPGGMSLLSVSVQFYCQAELGVVISADKFDPPPKVDSQVLILTRRPNPLLDELDSKHFFRVVKAGFSQRRKTLLNSLSGGLMVDRDQASQLIIKAGLSPGSRPQGLSLDDWKRLSEIF